MSFFCRFRRCFIIVFIVSFSSLSTSIFRCFFRRFRRRFLCRFLCPAFGCKGLSRPGPGELPEIPSSAPTFIQPVPIFAPIREVCPDEISSRPATFFRLGMVKWTYHEQDRNTNNQLSTTISEYAMCEICNIKKSHTVYGFFCTLKVAFLTHIFGLNFPLPTLSSKEPLDPVQILVPHICMFSFLQLKVFKHQILNMASFVTVPEGSDFTLANLPYGVFSTCEDVSIG